MRSVITTLAFSLVLTVLAMNTDVLSQRIDQVGQQAIAGPHMPAVPTTYN